jgi:hypothetical protein
MSGAHCATVILHRRDACATKAKELFEAEFATWNKARARSRRRPVPPGLTMYYNLISERLEGKEDSGPLTGIPGTGRTSGRRRIGAAGIKTGAYEPSATHK